MRLSPLQLVLLCLVGLCWSLLPFSACRAAADPPAAGAGTEDDPANSDAAPDATPDDTSGAPADQSGDANKTWDETTGYGLRHGHPLRRAARPHIAGVLQHALQLPDNQTTTASLRQVLADPQFKSDDEIQSGQGPLERFMNWLAKLLGTKNAGAGDFTTILLTVALAVLLAFLIVRLIWELVQRRRRQRFTADGASRAEDMTFSALLTAASAAAARREYREALRLRFLALVKQLDLPASTVRTNSQLTLQVRKAQPAAASPFAGAVTCFEDAWYGGLPCGPDNYEQLMALASEVVGHFQPAAEAKP